MIPADEQPRSTHALNLEPYRRCRIGKHGCWQTHLSAQIIHSRAAFASRQDIANTTQDGGYRARLARLGVTVRDRLYCCGPCTEGWRRRPVGYLAVVSYGAGGVMMSMDGK
jgi:hypothetical protein